MTAKRRVRAELNPRNLQDATLRNVRATRAAVAALTARVQWLEHAMIAIGDAIQSNRDTR